MIAYIYDKIVMKIGGLRSVLPEICASVEESLKEILDRIKM